MTSLIRISPSLLAADFLCLQDEIRALEAAGADELHVDVMDGHFVPNLSMGPFILEAVSKETRLPLDVHLMISPVDLFIDSFVKAGATCLTFHPEAGPHPYRTLGYIKSFGIKAGIALSPGTPIEVLSPLLPLIDRVLVMTVNPGFGGQAFIESGLTKIKQISDLLKDFNQKNGRFIELAVDGGVSDKTAGAIIKAGGEVLIAGMAVLKAGRGLDIAGKTSAYKEAMTRLSQS